jgi:tetratricopeptide (TPR) repeat protein
MELLARLGDRAGALAAFGALAERLEREYEAEPDAPTAALAARIRATTSAPPVAPVAVAVVANGAERPADAVIAASAPAVPEGDVGFGPASLRFRQRARSAAVTVALMFGFISLFGLRRGADLEAAPAPLNARLLVEDARGPADVAEALTSDIVRRLAGAERIEVFVGSPPAGAEPLFLLRTTVRTDADTLRATAILTDRATGAALASMRAKEPVATGRAAERLGAAVVRFARRATGTELERREAELADVAVVARTAWLRGRNDLADADSLYDAGLGDAARVRLAAADSLLASAQRAADDWVQVPLDRAELELLRMWVRLTQPGGGWAAARPALALGIGHADDALRIAPRDTRALELRGVLQALLWLTTPSDSARAADPLLNAAYRDLKRATEHSGAAPRAWQYLSMIEFARGDFAQAYHAADRALDADAFLGDATGVRTQHFWSALEVGDTAGARRSCVRQGADDPESWHGSYCRMVLLAWPGNATPDLPDAMQLVSAAERKPWAAQNRGSLDAIHAVLLAQRGDAAGARDLLARVLHDSETRPELLHEAAWVYVTLGEPDRARELLERYVAGWPAARTGVTRSRRFAGVLD